MMNEDHSESKILMIEGSRGGRSQSKRRGDQGREKSQHIDDIDCYLQWRKWSYEIQCSQKREDLHMKDKAKVQDSSANMISYGDDFLMMKCLDDKVEKNNFSNQILDSTADLHICNNQDMFDD